MLSTLPADITTLMHSPDRWIVEGNELVIQSPSMGIFESVFDGKLSSLAELHPDFPDAVAAQSIWARKRYQRSHVYGDEIKPLLQKLINGLIELTPDENEFNALETSFGPPYFFVHLHAVEPKQLDDGTLAVWVSGKQVQLRDQSYHGKMVQIVQANSTRDYVLPREQFDTLYPGWLGRYQVGSELGIQGEELANYVFTRMPEQQTNMDGVSFEQ